MMEKVAQSLLPLLTPQDAVSDMVSSEGNMMMPGVDLFTRSRRLGSQAHALSDSVCLV